MAIKKKVGKSRKRNKTNRIKGKMRRRETKRKARFYN